MLRPVCKGKWHHYPLVLSFNLWTQLIKYAVRDFHRITKPYFPRESQNLFEVSTSRSPLSLSAPSRAYFISPKRRSRKRLPEESCTRSTVKIVIVFKLVKHPGTKTRMKDHAKAIATLDENSLLAKHHMLHSYQTDLESVEIVDLLTGHRRGDKD